MSFIEFDDDPFNEELLLSVICSLRNVPVPTKRAYNKRKKDEPKPKIRVTLDSRFLTTPPEHYKLLPEGDKRWKVAKMLSESYGGADRDHFQRVMTEICAPDIEFLMQYDGQQNPFGPNSRYISGLSSLVDFGVSLFNSSPDLVTTVYAHPMAYYDEETNCSFGCFKVVASMTKIGVVAPELSTSSSGSNNPFQGDVLKSINNFNLVRLPSTMPVVPVYQVTRYTYAMNADHKITKLCMLFKHIQPPSPSNNNLSQPNCKRRKIGRKKRKLSEKDVDVVPNNCNPGNSGN